MKDVLETDIGWVEITASDQGIRRLFWRKTKPNLSFIEASNHLESLLSAAKRQLELYFHGKLTNFDLPLAPEGAAFEKKVWNIMRNIPYGRTLTYGDVALRLNAPAQMVGQACGRNPIAILIPCHRIVGANTMGGYSSELGTQAKTFLLDLESGQRTLF